MYVWYITYPKVRKKTYTLNDFKRRENTDTSVSEHFFSKLMLKWAKTQSSIFSIICDYHLQLKVILHSGTYSVCCKCEWNVFGCCVFVVVFFFLLLKQAAALWTVPGTFLQMHLLISPLFLPEGKAGSILCGLASK